MKVILQRVKYSKVTIDNQVVGSINQGLMVLLGVADGDSAEEAKYLATKVSKLRVFEDGEGKMNKSVLDIDGEILIVPNFTLCANSKKGHRPSYTGSAPPDIANSLFEYFYDKVCETGIKKVEKGVFGGDMQVELVNDGPVTIILNTDEIMPGK